MKPKNRSLFVLIALLTFALVLIGFADARQNALAQSDQPVTAGIFRGTLPVAKFDVSPPLRDIAPVPVDFRSGIEILDDRLTGLEGPLGPQDVDPIVQTSVGPNAIPTPIISFNGPANISGVQPPDPNGDVGPNHVVVMSNLSFQIFDKAGNSLYGPALNNTLWAGFGGDCQTDNSGDPIVLHDQFNDRWILSQFTASGPTYFNCIAISTTSDPTGTYYRYAVDTGTNFPDYPKYGVWSNGYYISTREFAGANFAGVGAYVMEIADVISGNPTPTIFGFLIPPGGTPYNVGDGLLPADVDGSTLPPSDVAYFVGSMDDGGPYGAPQDALTIWKFDPDFVTPANSTFTLANTIPITNFDTMFSLCSGRSCIPQPGTANRIDILSYRQRPIWRLAYRNFGTHESLVTNQSVEAATGMAGNRWWEIRSPGSSPFIYQEGTFAPGVTDGIHRWMASVAMDGSGNMAIAYSASNATTTFPSVWYSGRLASDPLGTMPQGEASIINGAGSQTSGQRWGDYSSLTVDPVDDCTFWAVNQWFPVSGGNWTLRIGAFKFDQCGGPDFTLSVTPPSQAICTPNNAVYTVNIGQVQGYTDPVTLSTTGEPAGTTVGFSTNPVTPPGSSTLTIGNTGAAAAGSYVIDVIGTAPTSTHTTQIALDVFTGVPGAPTLVSPANGATGVGIQPTLTWTGTAPSYFVEVASDAGFTNIVESATVGTTQYTLTTSLLGSTTYFWRVTGSNTCGAGATSTVFSFTTLALSTYCQAPNLAIPDNNPTGVTTSLVVADSGTLEDLNVYLDVTHTWVGDIAFNLTHQDTGTSVTFFDRPGVPASTFGCSGNDIDAWLDDEAALPVETQCGAGVPTIQGTFSPNNPLSAFDGEDLSGTWVLRASDHAGGDTGTVVEWCLEPSVPAGGASGTLQGSVTDAWSASGLNNASLTADDGSNTYTTSTDANGDYTLPLPVGTYQVTAEASGYFSATVSGVLLVTNTLTVQDFALLPLVVDLGLTPAAFDITQAVTSVVTHTLTISSVGTLDLTWTLEEEPAPVVVSLTGLPGVLAPLPGTTGSRAGNPSAASQPPVAYVSPADFSEDFADITNLPGWYMQNNSAPLGVTNWFQGNDTVFPAQAGAPTAYIGANFNNTAGTGTISNWLLTPELSLNNGDTLSFWTRTAAGSIWPDRLQLRLSTAGASTNVGSGANDVGDFTELLLDVNPTLTQGGYPEVWTQYTVTLSGLPNGVTGRFAFRYYVTNGGPSGSNSNYIGVDTVEYVSNPAPSVCASLGDIPWVSVSPASGTTAPGSSTDVAVAFDTSGLTVGNTYTGTLCLSSNDDDTPLVTIPLTLTVEAQSFGVALSGDQAAATETSVVYTLTVTNTGNLVDTFDLSATGVWTATLSDTSLTLGAGESATFTVEVTLPAGVNDGDMDVTTVTATSQSDATATASATLTTTAIVIIIPPTSFDLFLPLISR